VRPSFLLQQRHATTLSKFRCSRFFDSYIQNEANWRADALSNYLAPLPFFSRPESGRPNIPGGTYMRKTSLITAVLLLSAVWAVAQTSPSSPQSTTPGASSQQPTSPSSTSPSQQPATPDTSSTTQTTTTQTTQTSTDSANSIEGCLSGSAGNWTLTDQSGKTWQLSGDTSKLSDHVGHQVRVSGADNSASGSSPSSGSSGAASATNPSSGAGATGAGSSSGSQSTFNVKKVKMISSTCSTTSK
jgi:hypothetical protein